VATDDTRIADAASVAGFDCVMTRADHQTGTDRIAEVAHNLRAEIIVNVQGDEPLIDPATIDAAVNALVEDQAAEMATTYEAIENAADVLNLSVVKVAFDANGYATNFSRNPIPFPNQAVEKYGSIEAALRQEPALLLVLRSTPGYTRIDASFFWRSPWPQSENERKESLNNYAPWIEGLRSSSSRPRQYQSA
jgi:3-deoxy-manno-octulosonate cytidylyltransferase (CMP-KDO synthetase)